MIEIRTVGSSSVRRFRNSALLALASLSAIVVPNESVQAGWFSISSKEKSAEISESKSKSSTPGVIRKVLKDAKAQEAEGNLDQAISLADQAMRLSERSANITKSEQDISPTTLSRYVNDLRLKKAEQSVKRIGPVGKKSDSEIVAGSAQSTSRFKQPVAEINRPGTKAIASAKMPEKAEKGSKPAEKSAERKDGTKNSQAVAAAAKPPEKAIKSTEKTLERKEQETAKDLPTVAAVPKPPAKPKPTTTIESPKRVIATADTPKPTAKPSASSRVPDEFDDLPMRTQTTTAKRESTARPDLKERAGVKVASFDDDTPLVEPKSPRLTADTSVEKTASAKPAAPKLRRQYVADIDADWDLTFDDDQKSRSELPGVKEPESNASATKSQPPLRDPEVEHNPIVPVAAEDEANSEAYFAVDSDLSSNDSKSKDRSHHLPQEEFPVQKAREMKRRFDTVTALEPGAVATSRVTQQEVDFAASSTQEDWTNQPGISIRKRPEPDSHVAGDKVEGAGRSRNSVFGQTSIAKWRSAKAQTNIPERTGQMHAKSEALPEDLRQSVRQSSTSSTLDAPLTTDTDKKNSSSNSKSSPPSDWSSDDVSGPVDSRSTSPKKSANLMTFDLMPPSSAPLPPTESADQHPHPDAMPRSFDEKSLGGFDSDSITVSHFSSDSGAIAPLSYSEDATGSVHNAHSNRSAEVDDVAADFAKTNRSTGHPSFMATVASSLLSLLSVVGIAAFMTGLWVLRVVVRSKNPS